MKPHRSESEPARGLWPTPGLLALAFALSMGALAVTHGPVPGSLDDVFVVLVEARGWLAAAGLGDAAGASRPTVEGATSLFDMLTKLLCLLLAPTWDPLRCAGWTGLAALGAVCVVAVIGVSRLAGSAWAAAVVGAGLVTVPGLIEGSAFLLESPWLALAWTGAVLSSMAARPGQAAAWSCWLAWVRPEGALMAPLLVLVAARGLGPRCGGPRWWVAAAAGPASVTLVRWIAYGAVVPNTFHAKSSDLRGNEVMDGLRYLGQWAAAPEGMVAIALVALTLLMALTGALALRSRAARAAGVAALFAGGYAVLVIASGGDSYTGARLAFPISLAAWCGVAAAWQSAPRWFPTAASALLLVQITFGLQGLSTHPVRLAHETASALAMGPPGLSLFAGDERAFAAVAAALTGETFAHRHTQRARWFAPNVAALDVTGLTDREVAQLPAPGPIRFGRDAVDLAVARNVGAIHLDALLARPRAMAFASLPDALIEPDVAVHFVGEPYVRTDLAAAIAAAYLPASFPVPEAGGYFNLIVRRDLAERFRARGFLVGE